MSRYSEKLERRREEAAREAEKASKAERHAAADATPAAPGASNPAPVFDGTDTAAGCLVLDLASSIDRVDVALHAADALVAVSTKGLAKSEALSVRNSLWAVREKIRGLHHRARRFYAISKEEAAHA